MSEMVEIDIERMPAGARYMREQPARDAARERFRHWRDHPDAPIESSGVVTVDGCDVSYARVPFGALKFPYPPGLFNYNQPVYTGSRVGGYFEDIWNHVEKQFGQLCSLEVMSQICQHLSVGEIVTFSARPPSGVHAVYRGTLKGPFLYRLSLEDQGIIPEVEIIVVLPS